MTEWIDIAKFRKRKGEMYVFFYPASSSRAVGLKEYYRIESDMPGIPRQATLYAVITRPLSRSKGGNP